MKKRIGFLLFFVALFATIQINAQNVLIANNVTSCQYTIDVVAAPAGGCSGVYSPTTLTIPPGFSGVVYTSAPGEWVVGTNFPTYGFGLSNPIGFSCNSFPTNVTFTNICGTTVTGNYTQAPTPADPSVLDIF